MKNYNQKTIKEMEEGYCPEREDETHCECWWDGLPCHSCGFHGIHIDDVIKQGMNVDDFIFDENGYAIKEKYPAKSTEYRP